MNDPSRKAEARRRIEEIVAEFADVFGPEDDDGDAVGASVMTAWLLISHWTDTSDLAGDLTGWTCEVASSSAIYPMRLGLLHSVINLEMNS